MCAVSQHHWNHLPCSPPILPQNVHEHWLWCIRMSRFFLALPQTKLLTTWSQKTGWCSGKKKRNHLDRNIQNIYKNRESWIFIFYLFIFLEVQSVAESEVILGGREDWREGRHGCIECQFEFGNYKLIITLKCSFAIFCPVMLSCTSAGLEKTHTWIHPGLEFCQLV